MITSRVLNYSKQLLSSRFHRDLTHVPTWPTSTILQALLRPILTVPRISSFTSPRIPQVALLLPVPLPMATRPHRCRIPLAAMRALGESAVAWASRVGCVLVGSRPLERRDMRGSPHCWKSSALILDISRPRYVRERIHESHSLKTFTVLSPLSPTPIHLMDDADLAGPILFFLLFGTFLLFSGKVHFGYIYGLALIGSLSLHTIFSLMSPPLDATSPTSAAFPGAAGPSYGAGGGASGGAAASNEGRLSATLTFPRSASVLGYCLLPLVLISCIGIVMPMDTMTGYLLNCLAISWCTYSSSKIFCAVGRMHSMRALVAYPLALFYVGFGLMGIFSSKGSTLGSKVTA